jgi:hypothetical protein
MKSKSRATAMMANNAGQLRIMASMAGPYT